VRYGWENNWSVWGEYPNRKLPCSRPNGSHTEQCKCNAAGIPKSCPLKKIGLPTDPSGWENSDTHRWFPIPYVIPNAHASRENTNSDNKNYPKCTVGKGKNNCHCKNGELRFGYANNWSKWWIYHKNVPCQRFNKAAKSQETCQCRPVSEASESESEEEISDLTFGKDPNAIEPSLGENDIYGDDIGPRI